VKENKKVKINPLGLSVQNKNLPLLFTAKERTQVPECCHVTSSWLPLGQPNRVHS